MGGGGIKSFHLKSIRCLPDESGACEIFSGSDHADMCFFKDR